jgi:hypothetical protein
MSEKTDIVTRLRDYSGRVAGTGNNWRAIMCNEAADTIEQTRLERDEARAESSAANDLVRLLQKEVCL